MWNPTQCVWFTCRNLQREHSENCAVFSYRTGVKQLLISFWICLIFREHWNNCSFRWFRNSKVNQTTLTAAAVSFSVLQEAWKFIISNKHAAPQRHWQPNTTAHYLLPDNTMKETFSRADQPLASAFPFFKTPTLQRRSPFSLPSISHSHSVKGAGNLWNI